MVIYNPIWVPSQPCLCWGLDERPNPWDFGTIFYCLASNLPNLQQVPNSERPSGWSWVMIPFWSGVWAQNGKSIPKERTLSATKPEERKGLLSARAFPTATSMWEVLSDSMELQGIFTKEWITGKVQHSCDVRGFNQHHKITWNSKEFNLSEPNMDYWINAGYSITGSSSSTTGLCLS